MLGQRRMPAAVACSGRRAAAPAAVAVAALSRRRRPLASSLLRPRASSSSSPSSSSPQASDSPQQQQPPRPPRRRLILLRHAASEEAGRARNDHERPLSAPGREEARAVAARLAALGWRPDLIVGSNSRRTVQTLDAMAQAHAEAFGSADAHLLGSLYTVAATDGQTRQKLSEVIAQVAGDGEQKGVAAGAGAGAGAEAAAASSGASAVTTVMAVGHNRGWEEAASSFARASVRLQTATAALLEHVGGGGGAGAGGGGEGDDGGGGAATWAEALAGEWRLVQVVSPSSP